MICALILVFVQLFDFLIVECAQDLWFAQVSSPLTLLRFFDVANNWIFENIQKEALIAVPALFVALLIPISVFLMERDDLYGFDKNVILDKVILYKITLFLILTVSLTLFVDSLRFLSVILCLAVLLTACAVVVRTYKWMSAHEFIQQETYKQRMRLAFLSSVKPEEKIDIWTLILNDKNLLEKNQRGLISEFIKVVTSARDEEGLYSRTHLFMLMSRNVHKIDFSDVKVYQDLVLLSIDYFKQFTSVRRKRKEGNKDVTYPPYVQKDLALNLLRLSQDENHNDALGYLYIEQIKKFVANDIVAEADFIRCFLPSYIDVFREARGAVDILWEVIPEWTITQASLLDNQTEARSISLLNAYMSSIGQEARADSALSDREVEIIDGITEKILPNINTSFWFDLLTLYNAGWGMQKGEDSIHGLVRSYASRRRTFGISNTFNWMDDGEAREQAWKKDLEHQDEETIFILGVVYPWLRSPKVIQSVLEQIEVIEGEKLFKAESYEAYTLADLKSHFEKIRDFTNRRIEDQKSKS